LTIVYILTLLPTKASPGLGDRRDQFFSNFTPPVATTAHANTIVSPGGVIVEPGYCLSAQK